MYFVYQQFCFGSSGQGYPICLTRLLLSLSSCFGTYYSYIKSVRNSRSDNILQHQAVYLILFWPLLLLSLSYMDQQVSYLFQSLLTYHELSSTCFLQIPFVTKKEFIQYLSFVIFKSCSTYFLFLLHLFQDDSYFSFPFFVGFTGGIHTSTFFGVL